MSTLLLHLGEWIWVQSSAVFGISSFGKGFQMAWSMPPISVCQSILASFSNPTRMPFGPRALFLRSSLPAHSITFLLEISVCVCVCEGHVSASCAENPWNVEFPLSLDDKSEEGRGKKTIRGCGYLMVLISYLLQTQDWEVSCGLESSSGWGGCCQYQPLGRCVSTARHFHLWCIK